MALTCNSSSPVLALVLSLSLLLQPLAVLSFSPKPARTEQVEDSEVRSLNVFSTYIVFTGNNPRPPYFSSNRVWYLALLRHVAGASPYFTPRLTYIYKELHGFAARMTAEQAKKLSHAPGVVKVLLENKYRIHEHY